MATQSSAFALDIEELEDRTAPDIVINFDLTPVSPSSDANC